MRRRNPAPVKLDTSAIDRLAQKLRTRVIRAKEQGRFELRDVSFPAIGGDVDLDVEVKPNSAPELTFRRLESTWNKRFIAAIKAHYTGSKGPPVGKKMAWEILEDGRHRGWIGLGEPAYKLAPRRRLGIQDARPLPETVSNYIFRLDAPGETKASQILRAWHPVAERDWLDRYGFRPVHWETLVDPSEVKSPVAGASFRRAGYRSIGMTTGRSARRPKGHTHGPRIWGNASPKLVLYRGPLHRCPEAKAKQ